MFINVLTNVNKIGLQFSVSKQTLVWFMKISVNSIISFIVKILSLSNFKCKGTPLSGAF